MRFLILLMVVACAGCAEIQYLDQALVLKGFSDEKDAQNAYVKAHDARFDELLRQSKEPDAFKEYDHKASVVRKFGDPILCRMEGALEKCLYRRIVKPLESPKVYLYFNAKGELVQWTDK